MKCRICDVQSVLLYTVPGTASKVSQLYDAPTLDRGTNVDVYRCPLCDHYQIPYYNPGEYYDDYVMTVSHSPSIQKHQERQAAFLASLAINRKRFIEIGCGDGNFLQKMKPFFEKTTGVEPSRSFYKICREKGLSVLNEYFTKNTRLKDSFDAFASRQVFEHLPNPMDVMSCLFHFAAFGAVGLIEVPNAQKMLSENRYYDLFCDHVNYFTPHSLCCLARKTGFTIEKIEESFQGDYLELYVKKQNPQRNLMERRDVDMKFILDSVSKYSKVSAWGAGAKACAILTAMENRFSPAYIFDSDAYKQEKYIVNSQVPIMKPSPEAIRENDLIIIFAISYQQEIISLLKNMGYTGNVLCLDRCPRVCPIHAL